MVEVDIRIGHAIVDRAMRARQIRFERGYLLLTDIGRIPNHGV